MKIFLGISGASGVNLGLKLAFEIAKRAQLHLCVSKNAMNVLEKELNFTDFFRKNGENLNIIGVTSGKFDEATAKFSNAARGGEGLNFRTEQNLRRWKRRGRRFSNFGAKFKTSKQKRLTKALRRRRKICKFELRAERDRFWR